jgi:hypothetical protein
LGAVPIDNAEQYRMTLEALADVEIQLAAVDETLCNLPMVVRDVMRRALSDNADLLREELRAYEAVHGPIPPTEEQATAAPVPTQGFPEAPVADGTHGSVDSERGPTPLSRSSSGGASYCNGEG